MLLNVTEYVTEYVIQFLMYISNNLTIDFGM